MNCNAQKRDDLGCQPMCTVHPGLVKCKGSQDWRARCPCRQLCMFVSRRAWHDNKHLTAVLTAQQLVRLGCKAQADYTSCFMAMVCIRCLSQAVKFAKWSAFLAVSKAALLAVSIGKLPCNTCWYMALHVACTPPSSMLKYWLAQGHGWERVAGLSTILGALITEHVIHVSHVMYIHDHYGYDRTSEHRFLLIQGSDDGYVYPAKTGLPVITFCLPNALQDCMMLASPLPKFFTCTCAHVLCMLQHRRDLTSLQLCWVLQQVAARCDHLKRSCWPWFQLEAATTASYHAR